MRLEDLREINRLALVHDRLVRAMHGLNEVNGAPDQFPLSIPDGVLELVDQKLAAKGLLSLVIESLAENEKAIEALGVTLPLAHEAKSEDVRARGPGGAVGARVTSGLGDHSHPAISIRGP